MSFDEVGRSRSCRLSSFLAPDSLPLHRSHSPHVHRSASDYQVLYVSTCSTYHVLSLSLARDPQRTSQHSAQAKALETLVDFPPPFPFASSVCPLTHNSLAHSSSPNSHASTTPIEFAPPPLPSDRHRSRLSAPPSSLDRRVPLPLLPLAPTHGPHHRQGRPPPRPSPHRSRRRLVHFISLR